MTSYKYSHDNGYQPMYSNENDNIAKSVCEALRVSAGEIDTFSLYAVIDDAYGAFLQSSKQKKYKFVQGLVCGLDDRQFNLAPAQYEKLDYYENENAFVGAKLPKPRNAFVQGKLSVLHKIIDAIEFAENDKPIVVVVKDEKEAYDCLLHIGRVLPVSYMKHVGYCIAEDYVKINKDVSAAGKVVNAKIRISFITNEISDSKYRSLAISAYVFDLVKQRDNYDRDLKDISQAIESVNERGDINNYARTFELIFKKDNYNEELGKIRSAQILLGCKNDLETAFKFLELYQDTIAEYKHELSSNVKNSFETIRNSIDSLIWEQIDELVGFKKNCPEYKKDVDGVFLSYMAKKMGKLSNVQVKQCVELILEDGTGDTLSNFISRISVFEGFEKYHQAFKIIVEVVVKSKDLWKSDTSCLNAITEAIGFCDIETMHEEVAKDLKQKANGEQIFECAEIFEKEEDRNLIYSILMMSAYRKDIDASKKAVRITGLMSTISKMGLSPNKTIEKITIIREEIADLSGYLGFELGNISDFMMDDYLLHSSDWITREIEKIPLSELVESVGKLGGGNSPYEGMIKKIYERLANFEFFKEHMVNITAKDKIHQVEVVYEKIWSDEKNRNEELSKIKNFFENLREEDKSSDKFKKFRSDFVKNWAETFSEKDKKEFLDKKGIAIFDESENAEGKAKIIEYIDNEYSKFGRIKQPKKKLQFVPFKTLLFVIIASVIMMIPPIVQSIFLEGIAFESIMGYVASYFEVLYVLVPVLVAVIHLLTYKLTTRNNLKRANKAAIACGVLPVVLYVASFLTFWFLNIDILAMAGIR